MLYVLVVKWIYYLIHFTGGFHNITCLFEGGFASTLIFGTEHNDEIFMNEMTNIRHAQQPYGCCACQIGMHISHRVVVHAKLACT